MAIPENIKSRLRPANRPGTYRMARINKLLQRELSMMLEHRVKNDTARNAVITGVECARDLEVARVYFTTVDAAMREPVLAELRNAKGALRSMLGQVLTLRRTPDLEFVIDKAADYGGRIDGILHNLGLDGLGPNSLGPNGLGPNSPEPDAGGSDTDSNTVAEDEEA